MFVETMDGSVSSNKKALHREGEEEFGEECGMESKRTSIRRMER
jgi:hypothetical protein